MIVSVGEKTRVTGSKYFSGIERLSTESDPSASKTSHSASGPRVMAARRPEASLYGLEFLR
jgi:hypothetical protein